MIDSMGANHIPISGIASILHLGISPGHAQVMSDLNEDPDEIRLLVAKNVATLVPAVFGAHSTGKGIKELRDASGMTNGTVGRIVTPGATSWNVSLLGQLAKALKVRPWQLLLPDLSVTTDGAVASIEGMKARQWPFLSLRRDELDGLTPTEMERLEKTIRNRISELKEDRPTTASTDSGKRKSA